MNTSVNNLYEFIVRNYGRPTSITLLTPQGVFTADESNYDSFSSYQVFGFNYSTISGKLKIQCKEGAYNA